jgi:hypothetical protein
LRAFVSFLSQRFVLSSFGSDLLQLKATGGSGQYRFELIEKSAKSVKAERNACQQNVFCKIETHFHIDPVFLSSAVPKVTTSGATTTIVTNVGRLVRIESTVPVLFLFDNHDPPSATANRCIDTSTTLRRSSRSASARCRSSFGMPVSCCLVDKTLRCRWMTFCLVVSDAVIG